MLTFSLQNSLQSFESFSHIFKHLHSTTTCFDSYSSLSFKVINKGNSKLDLKIKEALQINWRKPNLNAQQKSFISHPFAIASVPVVLFLSFFFFEFLFYLLFSLPLTLIIGVFYCLNYTSPLLHLISTHLVSHLSLSSIIFSISTPIISIFYCLNYILLLLYLL